MLGRLRHYLRLLARIHAQVADHHHLVRATMEAEVRAIHAEIRAAMPDNPALFGFCAYSQNDEDGIIQEIFRRIGDGETFLEIGCGDGLENNTHYLALTGWTGTWVDVTPLQAPFRTVQMRVTAENVASLGYADFLSLDIDGNDLYVLSAYLKTHKPKAVCVEYNAIFPPPAVVSVRYDPERSWDGTNYQGASLQAFVNAMPDYRLVCCNISGANAFFVRRDLPGFTDYPISTLYMPPRWHLFLPKRGHPRSMQFLRDLAG